MRLLLIFTFFISCTFAIAQSGNNAYAILFYNVENLFDCRHDSLKLDEEFLPDGEKHWSTHRMYKKLNGISKTILAANQWKAPAVVGLCEVENEFTLKQLIYNTGLSNAGYKYIHYESMDRRGIDVALLYRKDIFKLIKSSPIVTSDTANNFFTRDALYVKGIIANDTLHIVVNHWPSKRGGALASEAKRINVAQTIVAKIDSIRAKNSHSKLVFIGDFNADYSSPSIQYLLSALSLDSNLKPEDIQLAPIQGSHKYQGHWSLIDHIFISKSWMNAQTHSFSHKIIDLPFLLENDKTYSGYKPLRTYAGPRYIGGISDHLPVLINITEK